jgi:pentatricopeptide repeat protein
LAWQFLQAGRLEEAAKLFAEIKASGSAADGGQAGPGVVIS